MVRAKKRFLDMMNLKKQLRRLVIPIFVELALVMMLGATDTIMLSRHSDNAVAAVGVRQSDHLPCVSCLPVYVDGGRYTMLAIFRSGFA